MHLDKERYKTECDTSTCCKNHLSNFGTPEEAAQAYLQHFQHNHNHPVPPPTHSVDTPLTNKDTASATALTPTPVPVERLADELAVAAAALKDEMQALKVTEEKEERGEKRKLQSMAETEHLSGQLVDDNQALKRCKEEFIVEDHAVFQQMMSAVEALAQCSICCDTMKLSRCPDVATRSVAAASRIRLYMRVTARVLSGVFAAGVASWHHGQQESESLG